MPVLYLNVQESTVSFEPCVCMQVGFFQSNLALASDWQPASEADQCNPASTVTVNMHFIGDPFLAKGNTDYA